MIKIVFKGNSGTFHKMEILASRGLCKFTINSDILSIFHQTPYAK